MTRRERIEDWIDEQETETIGGSWQWDSMVSELRALWAVVDVAMMIDKTASGKEWWCVQLADALDAYHAGQE